MITWLRAKKAQFTAWLDDQHAREVVIVNARQRARDLALLSESEKTLDIDPEQQRKKDLWEQKHLPYGM